MLFLGDVGLMLFPPKSNTGLVTISFHIGARRKAQSDKNKSSHIHREIQPRLPTWKPTSGDGTDRHFCPQKEPLDHLDLTVCLTTGCGISSCSPCTKPFNLCLINQRAGRDLKDHVSPIFHTHLSKPGFPASREDQQVCVAH